MRLDFMKKIILLILVLFLTLPAFCTDIKNNKQTKDEVLLRAIINSDAGRLSKHYVSFREDYLLYNDKNDKSSVFAQIVSLEKKYMKGDDLKTKLNREYLQKTKDMYLYLAEYPADKSMSNDFVREFNAKKIIIPDADYDQIDDDIVMLISLINVYK